MKWSRCAFFTDLYTVYIYCMPVMPIKVCWLCTPILCFECSFILWGFHFSIFSSVSPSLLVGSKSRCAWAQLVTPLISSFGGIDSAPRHAMHKLHFKLSSELEKQFTIWPENLTVKGKKSNISVGMPCTFLDPSLNF